MSDLLLEQLAHGDGPVDPGPRFRARLWDLLDAELDAMESGGEPAATVLNFSPMPLPEPPAPLVRRRRKSGLAWVRASRGRTVSVAASVVALLAIGAGAYLLGEDPDAEQSIEVVDVPPPAPPVGSLPLPTLLPPPRGTSSQTIGPSTGPGTRTEESPGVRPTPGLPGAAPGRPEGSPRPWVVWYGTSVDGVSGIYTAVAGQVGTQRMVVGGGSYNAQPVLSPDRRQVAWTKGQEDADVRSIWIAGTDGSSPREISLPKCAVYAVCEYRWPTFAGDGARMAFMRGTANSTCTPAENCNEIVVYEPRSGSIRAVGYGDSPEWSPRRDEIAYSGTAGPEPHQACEAMNCVDREIRMVDVSTGQSRRVGSVLGYAPRFSPDGEWIAYQSDQASATAVMRRDGSQERLVDGCQQPSWAPDGRLACLMSVDGGTDVFLLDADDEPAQRLTFTSGLEAQFRIYAT